MPLGKLLGFTLLTRWLQRWEKVPCAWSQPVPGEWIPRDGFEHAAKSRDPVGSNLWTNIFAEQAEAVFKM